MKFARTKAFMLAVAMLATGIGGCLGPADAYAASKKGYGTATVRIFATTDMHGQSVKLNYDSASDGEGSLAQIAGIVKEKRKIKYGTSVTVDCGDNLYGIGAESLMKGSDSGAQYMYEEMKALGYDAITLGNHDFDYGVDYIKKAISDTGMKSKVVLSNVVDAKTKKNLYKSGMIVKKNITTTSGKKKTIRIGFVGAVVPSLTRKKDGMSSESDSDATEVTSLATAVSWQGIIETRDIVESVRSEAKALKRDGADLVIALIHSGIGSEKAKKLDDNVGYAVTAIPEVDAVCAGHTHMDFPYDSAKAEPYYDYSDTDGDGLMHGKALIEEKDHASSLGIADIKLGFSAAGKPYIKYQTAKIRKIKDSDPEDPDIVSINKKYDEIYQKIYDRTVTSTDQNADNYFGMIEDNPLIHLANSAKIEYGIRAVKNLDDRYKNAPVIASTQYQLGGKNSSDYLKIDGTVQVKDLLNLEAFNQQRAKVYYMTGAQLKESLEYQVARFYQDPASAASAKWDAETKKLVDQGLKPVLTPDHQNNWNGFRVYDGIEYVVDPSKPARYNEDGEKISDSNRIISLTRNGVPVSDDQIFILVSKNISSTFDPTFSKVAEKQCIVSKTAHISSMLETYMKTQTVDGRLAMLTDGNWKIAFPQGSDYIIKSSADASEVAKSRAWYQGEIAAANGFTFYKAALGTPDELADKSGPFVTASPLETQVTGDPVTVKVLANDISGVSRISYTGGTYKANDDVRSYATEVSGDSFTVTQNGTYTVFAEDTLGNVNVCYVRINNIDGTVSVAPTVVQISNRKKVITGNASPFAVVNLKMSGMDVDTKADQDGRFTFNLERPGNAGDSYQIYQTDIQGRRSSVVTGTVQRTGANAPSVVNQINNTDTTISGVFHDDPLCSILVQCGSKVYVPKDAQSQYKESSLCKDSLTKKSVTMTRTGDTFSIKIPVPMTGENYKIYGVDWIGRLSTLTSRTVNEVAPNQPKVSTVIAEDALISGSIPKPTSDSYTITVRTGSGKTYTGTAGSDGKFVMEADSEAVGTKVSVTASDIRDGVTRNSLARETTMKSLKDYYDKYTGNGEISTINDQDTVISGSVYEGGPDVRAVLLINGEKKAVSLGEDGSFEYKLETPLSYKDKVYLIVRNASGGLKDIETETVSEAVPDRPVVSNERITTDTSVIIAVGNRSCTAVLKSGKTFVKARPEEKTADGFVYKLTLPKKLRKKGTHLKVYLENSSGQSDPVSFVVKQLDSNEEE